MRRAVVLRHLDDELTVLDDVAPGTQRAAASSTQGRSLHHIGLQPLSHRVAASATRCFSLRCKAAPFALVVALPYELLPVLACDELPRCRERRVARLVVHREERRVLSIAMRAEEQVEERRLVKGRQ